MPIPKWTVIFYGSLMVNITTVTDTVHVKRVEPYLWGIIPANAILIDSMYLGDEQKSRIIRDSCQARGLPVLVLVHRSGTCRKDLIDFIDGFVPEDELGKLDLTIELVLSELRRTKRPLITDTSPGWAGTQANA